GVALLAWEAQATQWLSTLGKQASVEVHEDEAALQALRSELHAYLAGTCAHLPWSIDERCMRSAFQREVLQLTATIPSGAVMSYQGLPAAPGGAQGGGGAGAGPGAETPARRLPPPPGAWGTARLTDVRRGGARGG